VDALPTQLRHLLDYVYVSDLTFPTEIIAEGEENNDQTAADMSITDENKQALKKHWDKKIAIKPEIKNELIKKSCVSLAQAFDIAE
jgi:hypothetical protein